MLQIIIWGITIAKMSNPKFERTQQVASPHLLQPSDFAPITFPVRGSVTSVVLYSLSATMAVAFIKNKYVNFLGVYTGDWISASMVFGC